MRRRWLALLIVLAVAAAAMTGHAVGAPTGVALPLTVTVNVDATIEATSPSGAVVTYSATVSGGSGSSTYSCPGSGDTYGLGSHTATCTATDTFWLISDSGSATFEVVDTTDPVVTPPADVGPIPATSPSGATASYGSASATDAVDGSVTATCGPPSSGSLFPIGTTTITCSATDSSGNTGTASFTVTVSPGPSPPSPAPGGGGAPVLPVPDPPPSGTEDRSPPANVSDVKARLGDKSVRITWKNPTDGDFDHVVISREPGKAGEPASVIYEGSGASVVDTSLEVGTQYRYLLVPYDRAGNHPGGVAVVAVGRRQLLLRPADGAVVRRPPTLQWAKIPEAGYYNLQLWYAPGRSAAAGAAFRKVFSAWPTASKLKLERSWTFKGKRYTLRPGTYRWYVWPGIGSRSKREFGDLIGRAEFTVVKRV